MNTVVIIIVFQLFMDFLRSLSILVATHSYPSQTNLFLHNFDELSIRIAR